jgi:hypothetical protein
MANLSKLLSIPLIAIFTACVPKAPVEKDYFTGIAPINMWDRPKAFIKDFDNDGIADAILDENNSAIFYAKGYEKKARATQKSMEMTEQLRKYSSDFIKADNNLRYEAAKIDYEKIKQKYDTTGVKK